MSKTCKACNEKLKSGSKFCGYCGTPAGEAGTGVATPRPFLMSPTKLLVLSVLTLGIYDIYWFMKQWRYIKVRDAAKIKPFWRALFSILFVKSLFDKLGAPQATMQAVAYIALSLASRFNDDLWVVSLFSVVPLYLVQQHLNVKHEAPQMSGYSRKEIMVAVTGAVAWVLFLWLLTIT